MTRLSVAVRIRPLSQREILDSSTSIVTIENENTIAITNLKVPEQNAGDSRQRIKRFKYDFCFPENTTQNEVFESIESIVGGALKRRRHCCVLAYGQSASGKTHTMMGFPHDPGLTVRFSMQIFHYLQHTVVGDEILTATISYLEIYNEKLRDLLATADGNKQVTLKIREHPKKGAYVQGLIQHSVHNAEELLELITFGTNKRKVAATGNNSQSSRSHSVLTITCGGTKLSLVDLAGSEKANNNATKAPYIGGGQGSAGLAFREGASINKSLVALGNVISTLAERAKSHQTVNHHRCNNTRKYIPYRDSSLTWLLKDVFRDNPQILIINTISPSSSCHSETLNTLRFGQKAKLIVHLPLSTIRQDPRDHIIHELRTEIAKLRELLFHTNTLSDASHSHHSDQLPLVNTFEMNTDGDMDEENDQSVSTTKRDLSGRQHPQRINLNKKFESSALKLNRSQIVAAVTNRLYVRPSAIRKPIVKVAPHDPKWSLAMKKNAAHVDSKETQTPTTLLSQISSEDDSKLLPLEQVISSHTNSTATTNQLQIRFDLWEWMIRDGHLMDMFRFSQSVHHIRDLSRMEIFIGNCSKSTEMITLILNSYLTNIHFTISYPKQNWLRLTESNKDSSVAAKLNVATTSVVPIEFSDDDWFVAEDIPKFDNSSSNVEHYIDDHVSNYWDFDGNLSIGIQTTLITDENSNYQVLSLPMMNNAFASEFFVESEWNDEVFRTLPPMVNYCSRSAVLNGPSKVTNTISEDSLHQRRFQKAVADFLKEATELTSNLGRMTDHLAVIERNQSKQAKFPVFEQKQNIFQIPSNKYERFVRESCQKMEKKIQKYEDCPMLQPSRNAGIIMDRNHRRQYPSDHLRALIRMKQEIMQATQFHPKK